ncbi:M1 family metallopeptidase [Nibrella viscosa]
MLLIVTALFVVAPFSAAAQSPSIANYQIQVELNPATKRLTGRETLVWRNPSTDVIRELQFHLYLNAFKNQQSTFMRESGGQLRGEYINATSKEAYGFIDVLSMRVRNGENLTPKIQFFQPDDGNTDDQTVIRVPLSKPVGPGETITLDIAFRAKLPQIFARTGYSRDFFLVGQWFPKIGVYEPAGTRYATTGQWNTHQFHANSEFYADYGVYDVSMTTPKEYWVSATGLMQGETLNRNGTKTIRYRAEDVVDFAWTASPHFQVVEDKWRHVSIELLLQPEHRYQAQRHLEAAKAALAYFDKYLGRYPYPNLTIVDPPFHASGAAGMEYPTFITAGTAWGLPAGIRLAEMVTIHEFGHQYFMQLLASNEFEEAWLDEGINQYYEGRIMDETYGRKTSVVDWLGLRMGDFEMSRDTYVHLDNPAISPSYANTWQLPGNYYGALTYSKTATWMKTLEGLLGRPLMDEVMQTYFNRWKFRHPSGKDFIAIVNEITPRRLDYRYGPDMNWFFNQVLYGDQVCDYELHMVRNSKQGANYRSTVTVYRLGDAKMPVEVLVHFDDGSEKRLQWDGKARSETFVLVQPGRVEWAQVDPDQTLYIDTNLNNNSYAIRTSAAPTAKYTAKFLFWVQNLMQWLTWLA